VANKAAARKVDELFYYGLIKGMSYVEQSIQRYEQRYLDHRAKGLTRQAKQLGLVIFPLTLVENLKPSSMEVHG